MKQKVIFNLYALGRRRKFVTLQVVLIVALTALTAFSQTPESSKQQLANKQAAANLLGEARTLAKQGTSKSMRMALAKFEEAKLLYRTAGNKRSEAVVLNEQAQTYEKLADYAQAIEKYKEAIALQQALRMRFEPSVTYRSLGRCYAQVGKYAEALASFRESLTFKRQLLRPDKAGVAETMIEMAKLYVALGKKEEAARLCEQAMHAKYVLFERSENPTVAHNIGVIFYSIGTSVSEEEANRILHAADIHGYGDIRRLALAFFSRALQDRVNKDVLGTAQTLTAIADVLTDLRKEPVLASRLEEYSKFLERYNPGLPYVFIPSDLYSSALSLWKEIGNLDGQAYVLMKMGERSSGQRSLDYYSQALKLSRAVGNRRIEATTLSGLMNLWISLNNGPLAVIYGKQSVDVLQGLRSNIQVLDEDFQREFLLLNEATYRLLADTLIALGRLPEAELVLEMLKEEEFSQYVRRDASEIKKLSKRIGLRDDERAALERYTLLADKVSAIGLELTKLTDKKNSLSAGTSFPEQARYDELVQQLDDANKAFRVFVEKDLIDEIGKTAKKEIENERALQGKLEQWGAGTVALYTIVGADRYRVILTTPKTQTDGKNEISAADLNEKIFAFRKALHNPKFDPRPLGQQLYNIIVKPIENDLKGAQAETLVWSLDGTLRYIPIGALWDGEKYLAEKYRIVVITSTTRQSLSETVEPNKHVLGLGVTKQSKVIQPFSTRPVTFDALPGVRKELQAIVDSEDAKQKESGLLSGKRLVDDEFTAVEMKKQLGQREGNRRKYNIIHFATHFLLGSDAASSFLLLGNNQVMTLEQVSDSPEMTFTDVELVTLSACNTGYGSLVMSEIEEHGKQQLLQNNGKEVDSLAGFIEGRGAKAVLATLWPVADASTQLLMTEFYRLGTKNPNMTKAEALRQAQLSLLTGGVQRTTQKNSSQRAELIGQVKPAESSALPLFQSDPKAPYAHPYYWAPFILIGNWR